MTHKFKLIGTDDSMDTCCCCGRVGSKRVVWLAQLDTDGTGEGVPQHYGTTCAARLLQYAHPTSASTKLRVELESRKAAEDRRSEAVALVFRTTHATAVVRGKNQFGTPTADVVVNGETVTVVGRGPWCAEGSNDEVRLVARRVYANKKVA